MKRAQAILIFALMFAVILAARVAWGDAGSQSLTNAMSCSGDSCVINSGLVPFIIYDDNSGPYCKIEGSDEYEPCSWQAQRDASAKEFLAAKKREAKDKDTCRAKGCIIVRQKVTFMYTTYPPSYPPDWRCECETKAKAKKEPKK